MPYTNVEAHQTGAAPEISGYGSSKTAYPPPVPGDGEPVKREIKLSGKR